MKIKRISLVGTAIAFVAVSVLGIVVLASPSETSPADVAYSPTPTQTYEDDAVVEAEYDEIMEDIYDDDPFAFLCQALLIRALAREDIDADTVEQVMTMIRAFTETEVARAAAENGIFVYNMSAEQLAESLKDFRSVFAEHGGLEATDAICRWCGIGISEKYFSSQR